jgi:hypothetical protein
MPRDPAARTHRYEHCAEQVNIPVADPSRGNELTALLAAPKAKPFGWRCAPALTSAARGGHAILLSGRRNGAAGVEQRNGRQKTGSRPARS